MSIEVYEKYKTSGVTWLGSVPEHWDICALKRIAWLQSGDTISAERIAETGDFPVFGGNGLRGYTTTYTHDGTYALIGRQGALCGNINYATGKFFASEHAVVVTPLQFIETRWLGELLRAMNLNQYSISAAQPGLSVEIIRSLPIPLPPKSEQSAIADFLRVETGKIDSLAEEQQRLIGLLKEKRRALIAHAVLKGLNASAPMSASGADWIGRVPSHWQVVRLGTLFKEASDPGNDDLPLLSVSIHHGVSDREFDDDELDRKVMRSEDRTKYKCVRIGDLVYNMMRAWQGGFGTVTVPGMVSPAYVVARPITAIHTEFIEQVLRTPTAIEELRRHSHGVTDFRLRLYWDEFKSIKVPIPPLDEQQAILSFLNRETAKIDALTTEAESGISLLQERRMALIAAVVTGKIDVRGAAIAQEETEAAA